ncbi:ROK family transcriptional regulator [Amycolatopsis sp. SID8362]|uniref:ROK family transcriptional regulator n=1 Tax=Amycolatopsis sp. SID8362 TaxID=2690346 RepID=UPI001370C7CA|nr:ROK family transcriptional regulator [Amycolatopsis sp. SID8362]NBH02644.1 ROK family protein [Amycolatopsis sp. SID8362]NED39347.1 ROK family transcriptional regulator [Amycolatopsis sp. SID8362]
MSDPDRPLPRLAMLRAMTDRAVLDQVFTHGRTTRAELAAATGISKPTISESVRRLETAGALRATGTDQTGRRGRIATFYELAADAGRVVAAEVNQQGVRTVTTDLTGAVLATEQHAPDGRPITEAVRVAVAAASAAGTGPARATAVSVANPVDPVTHEVVALPGSPFPEGRLRAGDVGAGVLLDNDVNFSALAERREGAAREAKSFAYVYVGAGLGVSLYVGDQLVRGAHGLAGEIGYLDSSGSTLASALADQGFGRPDAPSLDVGEILTTLDRAAEDALAAERLRLLGATLGRAVAAICTIVDPDLVLLGGPAGSRGELVAEIRRTVRELTPGPVWVEAGEVTDSAALRGALLSALDHGRDGLLRAVAES